MIQFDWAVGLDVTLASHGLIEALLFLSGGAGFFGFPGSTRVIPSTSAFGSSVFDSVSSQSQSSLPSVTGLSATTGSEASTDLLQLLVNEPVWSQMALIAETSDADDVPLAVLADHEKLQKAWYKKKTVSSC